MYCNVLVYYVLIQIFDNKIIGAQEIHREFEVDDDNDNVKQTFANLLKTIVRVNEERIEAMKKISELQDYMLTKNRLKKDEDSYDSMEEEENRVVFALDGLSALRRTEEEAVTREMCGKLFLGNNVRLWTSQLIKQTCYSQASALCTDACMKTFTSMCDSFQCRLKKEDYKIKCHENCRNVFEQGKP